MDSGKWRGNNKILLKREYRHILWHCASFSHEVRVRLLRSVSYDLDMLDGMQYPSPHFIRLSKTTEDVCSPSQAPSFFGSFAFHI